ncbi:unnamed protein product [Clonostachys rhizophaga]|uniref:Membrane transporter n=1 Tax=Clonostachys rhizophaga TaxID=160324 RepID=A0A9N9VVK2_9HYPO|nr:unnamed protein product [Clonostachys rhizophaga]
MALKILTEGRLPVTRPFNQNFIMGMILFCIPGIYLALTGLGAGGGQASSQRVASLTNAILYGIYAVVGWCAGSILNYLKPKYTIALGAIGYPFYVGSLWYYDRGGSLVFPLFSGALLGICAALFWTSSGFIQFAYAEEKDKATYITYQWVLSSLGSTVGALIAFGANRDGQTSGGISSGVYVAFIVIMCFAIGMDFLLIVDPKNVVRDDGSHIAIFKKPKFWDEVKGVASVLTDQKIVILMPAMFVGEMCLALVSSINGYYFNLRTRSLNNLVFQAIMIPAPIILSYIIDNRHIKSRRTKGLCGAAAVALVTIGATGGLLAWIITNDIDRTKPTPAVDWTDPSFAAGFLLYILFGVIYACFQIAVQWTLGSLTNEPSLCARYAGAFKGTVSLGMCISFILDSEGISFRYQAIIQMILYVLGLLCLAYVITVYVKETNYFSEETVIVPESIKKKMVIQADVEVPPGEIANSHPGSMKKT